MDPTRVFPLILAVVTVLLAIIATISADDVKHKRVIVKVPKKINHVHHHHVKKVHVYKHKPKPIHSIHVVEEEEPIGKEWKNLFRAHQSKHSPHKGRIGDGWKYDIEEEEEELGFGDEDDEDEEEEEYHKSGSHNEPTVWRGLKKGEKWGEYRGGSKKGRNAVRTSWKDDRPKRQHKNLFYYRNEPYSSRRPYSQKRPKKSNRASTSKKSKKSKSRRPIDKGYADYGEYNNEERFNESPIWPERKEHISWHMRENPWSQVPAVPQVTESPHFVIEDYKTEHKGEINLSKPEIQVVEAPQLGQKHVIQQPQIWTTQEIPEPQVWTKQLVTQSPYLWTNEEFQQDNLWPKEAIHQTQTWSQDVVQVPQQMWIKPVNQEPDWKNSGTLEKEKKKPLIQLPKKTLIKKVTARPLTKKPVVQEHKEISHTRSEGFRTEIKTSGTGYTSHVGHTADGDAASFQSVRFGDKIRTR